MTERASQSFEWAWVFSTIVACGNAVVAILSAITLLTTRWMHSAGSAVIRVSAHASGRIPSAYERSRSVLAAIFHAFAKRMARWELATKAASTRIAYATSARATSAGITLVRATQAVRGAATAGLLRSARATGAAFRMIARAAWACASVPPLIAGRAIVAGARPAIAAVIRWKRATAAAVAGVGRAVVSTPRYALDAIRERTRPVGTCPICATRLLTRAGTCPGCGEWIVQEKLTARTIAAGKRILFYSGRIALVALYLIALVVLIAAGVVAGAAVLRP